MTSPSVGPKTTCPAVARTVEPDPGRPGHCRPQRRQPDAVGPRARAGSWPSSRSTSTNQGSAPGRSPSSSRRVAVGGVELDLPRRLRSARSSACRRSPASRAERLRSRGPAPRRPRRSADAPWRPPAAPRSPSRRAGCRGRHQARHGRLVPPRPPGDPLPRRRPPGPDRPVLQEPPQVVGQLLRRRVAARRVLGHRLEDDRLQVARAPPG